MNPIKYCILIALLILVVPIHAQDSTVSENEDYQFTRTVCVEQVGCILTLLSDDQLDDFFGDRERFVGQDVDIHRYWTVVQRDLVQDCTNPSEDSFDAEPFQMDLRIESPVILGDDYILVSGINPFTEYLVFKQIASGVYLGENDEAGFETIYYIITPDDASLQMIMLQNADGLIPLGACFNNSIFDGEMQDGF